MAYSKHPLAQAAMKTAALPPGIGGKMLENPLVQGALASTAISAGIAGVSAGASLLKDVYDRSRSFKQMLELTPALRDHSDQASVKRYFNSLHRVNPHFMNDPSVAGALVHRVIESQESLGGAGRPASALATMVSDLAKGRADLSRAVAEENRGGGVLGRLEPHLQRNVEVGINAFHDLKGRGWETQAAQKQKELESGLEAKRLELESQGRAHAAAYDRVVESARARAMEARRQADEAQSAASRTPPGMVRVERRGSPGATLIPRPKEGPGGVFVSPQDHPFPPSGGISKFKRT